MSLSVVVLVAPTLGWTPRMARTSTKSHLDSTPFEADYYDGNNVFMEESSPLAVPADTKLVVGINKYSHDTSLCASDASSGHVLFYMSKERSTRKKHDSGNVASLVEECLQALDLDLDAVETVVVNNHHHRVFPLEASREHMEWECGLGINQGTEEGYDDEENLLTIATTRMELSHHLAHAYSAATQAPFGKGMVVVMDGMGETYRAMARAEYIGDTEYTSDLSFGEDTFQCIPSNLKELSQYSHFDWREAESVYVFEKMNTSISIRPVFKRFQEEKSPPALYNHGFENMDSVGALYSRASSHIFGDWNACGKVMGLAPWKVYEWNDDNDDTMSPTLHKEPIMWGTLYSEDNDKKFECDRKLLMGLPYIARNDPDLFDKETMVRKRRYDFDDDEGVGEKAAEDSKKRLPVKVALDAIALAARIQDDLEVVCMDFVRHFQKQTGETNLCLAGGVALNSVLNGRLARELGFDQTFIPPYPGDDGIAIGCCAYGLFGNAALAKAKEPCASLWTTPVSPYLGPDYNEFAIKRAIEAAAPWLDVETIRNEDRKVELIAEELEMGTVVAWYQGRSEIGPRALGHRSILADPRKKGLVRFINEKVKKRESFRPFAPSVLAEEARDWFDLGPNGQSNVSPYMSMTAYVHEDKRAKIPAVTHVDGSSRLQTVTKEAEPLYHKLISAFFARTGVPMVLNTSFNTLASEPIVETPQNAIRSFLCSMGGIEILVMGDYIIKRKPANLKTLLGEARKEDGAFLTEATCPTRTGAVSFESTFRLKRGSTEEDDADTVTRVLMKDRPMHHDTANSWFTLKDELEGELLSICDGTNTLNDMGGYFTARPEDDEMSKEDLEEGQEIFEQIARRLIRLYEHTLISW